MSKILVIGSSNTDIIMRVPALPRPGETVIGSELRIVQGGKGANQAVTAARMGAETVFVACVGRDHFGNQAIRGYEADGIDTSFIKRSVMPTGIALIHIADNGENTIAINAGANKELREEHITEALFDEVDFLLIQLEIPSPTIIRAVELAHKMGVKTILNPAPARSLENLPFEKTFLFTPNEIEAEFYTGITVNSSETAGLATEKLHEIGIPNVIITMGQKGAYCSLPAFKGMINGFSVEAVDTTAAGDVFNGALAVGMGIYENVRQAVIFAHAAAALSVKKLGAQPSIPTLDDVMDFLNQ
ncbi:MAG: ribokinase [Bacteroidetes bacterium]|nr:ribokinase [Bacteroidota bacterium]